MRPVAALLTALLLAACTTAPTSPSRTPRPSVPAGLELIAAGYLDLVDASNAATCTFNAALSQSAPALEDLKRASADYAESLIAFTTGLRKIEFPAEMEGDVVALDHAIATNHGHVSDMAAADTLDAFIEADDQLIEANKVAAAAATQLRADLGLGPAGNPCS